MSHEERITWSLGVMAPLAYVTYLALTFVVGDGPLDGATFVWPMIWTIGGGIVAGILAGIVVGIVSGMAGDTTFKPDQRDKEIGWLGRRVGGSFIVIGGLGALILCFVQAPHAWIANVLYLAFIVAAIVESIAKLVVYRRGF